ncbi:matrixin family metalloprotease [Ruminiclostridium josui]|uniref:matrixin family metalloprotease n=2 Tax=Ruminiclostridium josui TaxID=1499 RepID=UPI00046355BB|nr:matrixin family metalloprotease [Ruminiclostridium josui]
MKKRSRKIISFAVVLAIILSTTGNTFAYMRLGKGKISGGAKGILYYIDSSASEYSDSINYGIQYWNNKVSTVSVARTDEKSSSRCDVYWGSYFPSPTGVIAQTYLKLNNQDAPSYDTDWYWCEIKLNSQVFKYYDDKTQTGLSYFDRIGTVCHEYGHFLGLWHVSDKTAIMSQLGDGRTAGSPSADDIAGIKAIYGA